MTTEDQIARRLAAELDRGLIAIEPAIRDRLAAARREALNHQRAHVRVLSLAGIGRTLGEAWFSHGRAALAALAVVGLLYAGDVWRQSNQVTELEEVDSALLADDLPIDAYLDRGFDRWLKHDSDESSKR
jgi:hypothetical protein